MPGADTGRRTHGHAKGRGRGALRSWLRIGGPSRALVVRRQRRSVRGSNYVGAMAPGRKLVSVKHLARDWFAASRASLPNTLPALVRGTLASMQGRSMAVSARASKVPEC